MTATSPAVTKPKAPFRLVTAGLFLVVAAALIMVRPGFWRVGLWGAGAPDFVQAQVVILPDGRALRVQTHEVTVAQWQACHVAGACDLDFSLALKSVDYPATGLSYPDAMQFIAWVNGQSQMRWRLPSAAEWAALAVDVMPARSDPIFTDPALTWASAYLTDADRTGRALRPSGAFSTTAAGIADLDGNVWEWTQDCYAGGSGEAPVAPDRCPAFIMGGEHEAVMPYLVRDPARGGCAVGAPPAHLGMRMVADSPFAPASSRY